MTKPDLVYRIGDRLIIREFKTSSSLPKGGAEQVYGQTTQVAFLLSMLSSGLKDAYGAKDATVEVEVLTPDGSELYAWDLEDDDVLAAAREDLAVGGGSLALRLDVGDQPRRALPVVPGEPVVPRQRGVPEDRRRHRPGRSIRSTIPRRPF